MKSQPLVATTPVPRLKSPLVTFHQDRGWKAPWSPQLRFQGWKAPWLPFVKIEVEKPLGYRCSSFKIEKPLGYLSSRSWLKSLMVTTAPIPRLKSPFVPFVKIEVEKPLGHHNSSFKVKKPIGYLSSSSRLKRPFVTTTPILRLKCPLAPFRQDRGWKASWSPQIKIKIEKPLGHLNNSRSGLKILLVTSITIHSKSRLKSLLVTAIIKNHFKVHKLSARSRYIYIYIFFFFFFLFF